MPSWIKGVSLRKPFLVSVFVLSTTIGGGHVLGLTPDVSEPQASPEVGYIERLDGDLTAFSIERTGRSLDPAILLPLRVGDRVTVHGSGKRLVLQCGNQHIHITEAESPYVVPVPAKPPGFLGRLSAALISAGKRLTDQHVRSMAPASTNSRGQDEPLSMPMLDEATSRVRADSKRLYVAWQGGTPPYRVRLFVQGKADDLAQLDGIAALHAAAIVQDRSLPLGLVQIEVRDGTGAVTRSAVEVIQPTQVPPVQGTLLDPELPTALMSVLYAEWLSRTNPRKWSFQAYQIVAPVADSYEPARLLRDCLEAPHACHSR